MNKQLTGIAICCCMLLLASPCFAQEGEGWDLSAGMALWAAGVDATLYAGTASVSKDLSFFDLLENIKGVLMGEATAKNGKFSLNLGYMGLALENDMAARVLGGDRTVEASLLWSSLLLGYDLFETPVGEEMELTLTPLIGARYYYNRFVIDRINGGELRDRKFQWVDFVAGGMATLDVNEKISLILKGTAGGFGMGKSSEMAWSVGGFLDYHRSENWTYRVGYLHFDLEKERTRGTPFLNNVGIEMEMSGPVFEAIYHF